MYFEEKIAGFLVQSVSNCNSPKIQIFHQEKVKFQMIDNALQPPSPTLLFFPHNHISAHQKQKENHKLTIFPSTETVQRLDSSSSFFIERRTTISQSKDKFTNQNNIKNLTNQFLLGYHFHIKSEFLSSEWQELRWQELGWQESLEEICNILLPSSIIILLNFLQFLA